MVSFHEMTPAELAELPDNIEPLTAIELRALALALEGDGFSSNSIYAKGLTSATDKVYRMLDEVRVKISRTRRGVAAETPAE